MATDRRAEAKWIESKQYWEIKVQKDGTRKSFRSPLTGRKGKHEAEAKADKWLSKGTEQMRFDQAWYAFTDSLKMGTGTGNYKNNEQYGRLHLLPHLKHKKLSLITRMDWQKCINEMANTKGLSERTCKNVVSSINAFICFCEGEHWDVEPIKKKLTVPNSATPEKEKTIIQPDALKVLFSKSDFPFRKTTIPAWYINAWRFYVVTGMRRGELAGLRKEDVGITVSIKRNINNYLEETHGKNSNARRTMKLGDIASQIICDQQEMLRQHGIDSPWVFPDKNGERSDPRLIYKHWVRYQKYHGLEHCSIQGMRRTFVSINKIDTPLELIKMLVGHSVSMDTIGVYGREVDGEKERAAQHVDNAFRQVLNPAE